jgi:hypothetical protein
VDREEHTHVTTDSVGLAQQRVTRDVGAEQRQAAAWINGFIWLIFGVIIGLIALRVGLKLIAANPGNTFAAMIYAVTDLLLLPFFGLTGSPAAGGFVLEIPALIAMVVYLLAAGLLTKLVSLLFYRPSSRVVSHDEHVTAHRH